MRELGRQADPTPPEAEERLRVTSVKRNRDGSWVTAKDANGAVHAWHARFVIDASGRDTFLAGRLGLKESDKNNNTAAIFAHFTGVAPLHEREDGNITIHLFDEGWFWAIPLREGVTSIGVVGPPAFFKS